MRAVIANGVLPAKMLWLAVATNIIYLVLVNWFFYKMFAYVKRQGKLMKLND